MTARSFVPSEFDVPVSFDGPGFRLEPLGEQHNERDYDAWMSSIEHIRATPGFGADRGWPVAMSMEANRADLVGHARDFEDRDGFTYSILDGESVIGCVYIYPSAEPEYDANVSSWVRASRSEMDPVVYQELATWLRDAWPFESPLYSARS
jgi:hypothetical protein